VFKSPLGAGIEWNLWVTYREETERDLVERYVKKKLVWNSEPFYRGEVQQVNWAAKPHLWTRSYRLVVVPGSPDWSLAASRQACWCVTARQVHGQKYRTGKPILCFLIIAGFQRSSIVYFVVPSVGEFGISTRSERDTDSLPLAYMHLVGQLRENVSN
jgi:hypothetical protein